MKKKNERKERTAEGPDTKLYYQESFEVAEETLKQRDSSASAWLSTWKTFVSEAMASHPELSDFDTIHLHHVMYHFDRAQTYADSLRESSEKRNFFVMLETDFEQFLIDAKIKFSPLTYKIADNGFGQKCRLEIAKYDGLLKMEGKPTPMQVSTRTYYEIDPAIRGRGVESTGELSERLCSGCGRGENYANRNLEVVTLILNDILDHCGIQPRKGVLTTEDYAKMVGFITGYSANTTKRVINSPDAKEEKARNAYDKDNEVRKEVFKTLGLHDLVKKVQ